VIVRLMGEGQWRVDDSVRERLNALDDEAVQALERNDEGSLDAKLEEMWQVVRAAGEQLPADDLSASDVVIPPADLTLEETRELFAGEGLIPDLPGVES
jgi:chromosome condensin MukBEF complex kleisin-like MukF subunit